MGNREWKKHVDNYQIRIDEYGLFLEKFNKLALNPFADTEKYVGKMESVLWT